MSHSTREESGCPRSHQLTILNLCSGAPTVKGFQVAPVELDSLFVKHPAVADVAAGSVHEANEGTDVAILYVHPADLSLVDTSDLSHEKQKSLVAELAEWVKTKTAYYKWPRYYVFTNAVPKSPSGKVSQALPGSQIFRQ